MNTEKKPCVAIFGGNGNMGKVMHTLFNNIGYQTIIVDPTLNNAVSIAEIIRHTKILYFSVFPIESIVKILNRYSRYLSSETIIIDNASLKNQLLKVYSELDLKKISICSSHPLVKHDQPFNGQTVLLMPIGENYSAAEKIALEVYNSVGMKCEYIDVREHDNIMTVMQLIPHIIMRSTARMFEICNIELTKIVKIAPANFQLFLLSMFRTITQDAKISAKIISSLSKSDESNKLLTTFVNALLEIKDNTEEQTLAENFKKTFGKVSSDNLSKVMNEKTILALDRLTNLSTRSVIIRSKKDSPGLLFRILKPFADNDINLNAIDSHKHNSDIRFEIGIDSTTSKVSIDKVSAILRAEGYEVTVISNSPL